jgi:hypothetical protein
MTIPTHTNPGPRTASYDDRGPLTGAPTALTGSVRVVADDQRVVGLPAQRRLVPELRRESPAVQRAHEPPTLTARRGDRHQFSRADVPYVGVHQPNEQARHCRTCPMSTTWPHGYCSRCTALGGDPGCGRCRPAESAPAAASL